MKAKLKVIKIGGQVIDQAEELQKVLADFAQIDGPKILVHGGGKLASDLSLKLGIEAQFHQGRRITSASEIDIISMVYSGLINTKIVAGLQALQCNAIGLNGADGNVILAEKRPITDIDFGFVGDIISVNAEFLKQILDLGLIPVFCAISHDQKGQVLNTNADTIAAEIAMALSAEYDTEIWYCFEKAGVLEDAEKPDTLIENLNLESYRHLVTRGKIHSGMLPKTENCFRALNHGVKQVKIGSPQMLGNPAIPHSTLNL